MEHERTNWKCIVNIVNTFLPMYFSATVISPIRMGLVLSGEIVWFWIYPPFEFCVVHSHGISKACDFTDLSPGYQDVKALRVPFYGPVRWI